MTDATNEELGALIERMGAGARLRLRRALVLQAVHYVTMLLREGHNDPERACLLVVARWLEQPDDPAVQQAIAAEIRRGEELEWKRDELDLRGEELFETAWDAARATQVALPEAARLAAEAAGATAAALSPPGGWADSRAWRVAAGRAAASARQWQLAAAQAILGEKDLPPLPALPGPLRDPAEIFAAFRSQTDAQRAYERGDMGELRLLLSEEQAQALSRLEWEQATRCAVALRPPPEEGGATQAPPGPLREAYVALVRAQMRRRQANMARAVASGRPLPAEPDESGPLGGRLAAYRAGDLGQLCASLDAAGLLRLKRALLEQALWYALQVLPGPAGDRGHLESLMAVEEWLSQPDAAPPADRMGPVPPGTAPAAACAWRAVRGVVEAAQAPYAPTLLRALDKIAANATAAMTGTLSTSREALTAVCQARDYQLAAAFQISKALPPPIWLGPLRVYSPHSIDGAIWQMSEGQHGLMRWGLIHDCCGVVQRGLEANLRSMGPMAGGRQLVAALRAWAAHPEAGIRGAVLVPDAAVEAAAQAALAEAGQMGERLASALRAATREETTPVGRAFTTKFVVDLCEEAARRAAEAIAARWQLDAAYALLSGASLPPLVP